MDVQLTRSGDSEEEVFEDALESQSSCFETEMNLTEAINDSNKALHLFLDNCFQEAEDLLRVWSDRSFYHAFSLGVLHFVQAAMTSDPRDVDLAIADMNSTINICNQRRRKTTFVDNSMTKMFKKPDYDLFTEEEAHAELCYCEALMLKAALIFIHDGSIISYIKAGLNIHAAFNAFKECRDLLEFRVWPKESSKLHFETGVLLISGASNLFFASLPSVYLRILKFVGITGSTDVAFQKLERGHQLKDYVRGPFCTFLILTYRSILTYALGCGSADTLYCRSLIEPELKLHPQGAIYLFFFGRFEVLNGNFDKAIEWFHQSLSSQDRWRQLKHLCKWELNWCHMFQGSYRKALSYFSCISEESSWAKALTLYMSTILLKSCSDLTSEEENIMNEMMRRVPALKSKLSGKSIPIEKYFCSRAQRYLTEKRLFLPAEEIIYTFNYFPMLGKNHELLSAAYTRIDQTVRELRATISECNPFYVDDYCLGTFLKGVCLRYLNKPLLAEECFIEVCSKEKNLKEDIHLPVWSLIELGYMYNEQGNHKVAIHYFELARSASGNGRKKMAMRNRNQYKIHSGLMEAKKNV